MAGVFAIVVEAPGIGVPISDLRHLLQEAQRFPDVSLCAFVACAMAPVQHMWLAGLFFDSRISVWTLEHRDAGCGQG